ncbi:DUF808 family protein [Jidongwangia harbinensis]|uniref:DUF808 family protein n=1 Tax=Jidongwangia harbinensis TaxID=2878561 RepID=UPI001CD9C0FC|nr:DUF808 family protein [Jidongwangia harbinensis]MCA2219006.1 DUF808 domain-containing protein [Jidongwangia harbinensis]
MQDEKALVSGAVRTDLILPAEIMVITLSRLSGAVAAFGRGLVRAMPVVLTVLTVASAILGLLVGALVVLVLTFTLHRRRSTTMTGAHTDSH